MPLELNYKILTPVCEEKPKMNITAISQKVKKQANEDRKKKQKEVNKKKCQEILDLIKLDELQSKIFEAVNKEKESCEVFYAGSHINDSIWQPCRGYLCECSYKKNIIHPQKYIVIRIVHDKIVKYIDENMKNLFVVTKYGSHCMNNSYNRFFSQM